MTVFPVYGLIYMDIAVGKIDEAVKKQLDKIAHTTLLGLINKPSAELAKN